LGWNVFHWRDQREGLAKKQHRDSEVARSNTAAKALLEKYETPMPKLGLKPAEVGEILTFLRWSDRRD
jgi:hypothetical protein